MDLLPIVILFILLFICLWGYVCNNKTLQDRRKLLNEMRRRNSLHLSVSEDLEKFEKVSYHKHLFMLITFRDPSYLYK